MSDLSTTTPRAYPVPDVDDARFTLGLTLDVADVLARHGYPSVTSGADLVELQLALFRFCYRSER